jgi:ribosomal protein S18 acetylase RimI-like enzyme
MAAVGEIRVAAYQAGGHMSEDSGYAPHLRALGADGHGEVLVAVAEPGPHETGQPGPRETGPRETGPHETGQPGPRETGPHESGQPGQREWGGADDAIVGTVMLQPWPDGNLVTRPGEAEIRALAVRPGAQGAGVGNALLQAVIERARARGVRFLALFTQTDMLAAQHMYEKVGFSRMPDRDASPGDDVQLIAYGLPLTDSADPAEAGEPKPAEAG